MWALIEEVIRAVSVPQIVELPRFIGSETRPYFLLIDEHFDRSQISTEVTSVLTVESTSFGPLDSLEQTAIYLEPLGEGATLTKQLDLLQGTLDMLILKTVSLGPLHGYGILLRIQQISKDRLEILQGSLYPALYRMEHYGWITSEWSESENKRKAKYYRLTAAGKRRLQTETENWNRMADVIAGILHTTPEEG
jgi:PadR family transcriptional regulator